jgi:hypothetical protein
MNFSLDLFNYLPPSGLLALVIFFHDRNYKDQPVYPLLGFLTLFVMTSEGRNIEPEETTFCQETAR